MSGDSDKKSVISGAVQRFLARRLSELCGLLLLAMSGGLFAAYISASSTDPSLNVASDGTFQNWLGSYGATLSDLSFAIFGLTAFFIPVAFASWGYRYLVHVGLPSWYWRMPLMFFAVAIVNAAFLSGALYFDLKFDGIMGDLLVNKAALPLVNLFTLPDFLSAHAIVAISTALIGLWFYVWTAGLIHRNWGVARLLLGILFAPITWPLRKLFRRRPKDPELDAEKTATRDDKKAEKAALKEAKKQEALARKEAKKEAKKKAKQTAKASKSARKEPVLVAGADTQAEPIASKPSKTRGAKKAASTQETFDFETQSGFQLPHHNLLKPPSKASEGPGDDILQENARALENVLGDFGVNGEIKDVAYGPVVTRYGLNPAAGTKSQRVIALADDIARSMSALSVRVAVVPGQNVIGIEMPNDLRETVMLRDILDHEAWLENGDSLPICLGKDIAGAPVVTDLAKMPHLLVAGTTGSGKSVGINAMILSLLYRHTPETCRLIMIDPKMLELSVYDGIPHLLSPVVTDPAKAVTSLKWAVREMENRYFNMSKLGVRNITGYNQRLAEARKSGEVLTRRVQTGFDAETGKPTYEEQALDLTPLPFIVVIIDEVADLMLVAGKDIEAAVQRLAQMARAAGIHVIMATQRPSVDVITGTIKANFPTRISFQVTSKIDSRTILGEQGAEQLLGRGDMLFMEGGGRIKRVHGPFMEDQEVEKVADFLRKQGEPEYDDRVTAEPDEEGAQEGGAGAPAPTGESLYDQAVALVVREQRASTSFVQRHLKIGYNRAATIIEEMESAGIISKANHAGKREVLIQND